MNKFKKIMILPLGITAMGLGSCKPYAMKWHLITNEQAYSTIEKIKAKQKQLAFPTLCSTFYTFRHLSNGANTSLLYGTLDYDYENNYLKIVDAKLKGGSKKEVDLNTLYILQGTNGSYYRYVPSEDTKEYRTIKIEKDIKNELKSEIYNEEEDATKGYIGHFKYDLALQGHLLIKRNEKGSEKPFDYRNNILDEYRTYVDTSTKISNENKGSKTVTSEYYFQAIDDASLEYNESTNAPINYFPEVQSEVKDAKNIKRTANIKFINNYVSTASIEIVVTKNDNTDDTYILDVEVTNTVIKDKIIIPEE